MSTTYSEPLSSTTTDNSTNNKSSEPTSTGMDATSIATTDITAAVSERKDQSGQDNNESSKFIAKDDNSSERIESADEEDLNIATTNANNGGDSNSNNNNNNEDKSSNNDAVEVDNKSKEPTTDVVVNSSTTITELEDEDTVLYGSMTAMIADTMADQIDQALVEGLSTLPLLNTSSSNDDDNNNKGQEGHPRKKSDILLQSLQGKYIRNVDILEVYAQRNLFTISMFPPRRRQRIVQAYLDHQRRAAAKEDDKKTSSHHMAAAAAETPMVDASTRSETSNGEGGDKVQTSFSNDDTTGAVSSSSMLGEKDYHYPSKEQIPTTQAVADLTEEMKQLRDKLKAVRLQRNELLVACHSVAVADHVAHQSLDALAQSDQDHSMTHPTKNDGNTSVVDNVHGAVSEALGQGQRMINLSEEGQQLMKQLETMKRERTDNNDNDYDDVGGENDDPDTLIDLSLPLVVKPKKAKLLSLEDQYSEERQQVTTNTESLVALRTLLQRKG